MGIVRRAVVILLKAGIVMACIASAAEAQNTYETIKRPAKVSWGIGGCPNGLPGQNSTGGSGLSTCAEGLQRIRDWYLACSPGAIVDSNTCDNGGMGGLVFTFEPGGSPQPKGSVYAICAPGIAAESSVTDGPYCYVQAPFSKGGNLGDPQDCAGCVGNPINFGVGNKIEKQTDYTGSGPFPLKLVRFYNGLAEGENTAGMGNNWTHNYNRRLLFNPGFNLRLVAAVRGDGKVIPFDKASGSYVSDPVFKETLERTASGWRLVNLQDETEIYDNNGKLVSITNRAGLTQTLTYSGAYGLLATVTDPFGRTLTFTYNSRYRVTTVTAPGNLTFTYAYDTPGNLTGVTYPDSTVVGYEYNAADRLTGVVDEKGQRYSAFEYDPDSFGRPTSTGHGPDGSIQRFSITQFDFGGLPSQPVNQLIAPGVSATRNYHFMPVFGVAVSTSIDGPPCPSCGPAAQTFDANANILSRTDWNGNRTNYTYDTARNLQTSRTEGLTSGGGATAQTRTITTEWNTAFRLVQRTAEPLRITTNVYDADGTQCGARAALCSRSVQATTDASGAQGFSATASGTPRVWAYTHNANGQVLTVNGPRTDAADITAYTYYANDDADLGKRGNVATVTNAAGHVAQITAYDANGQPLTIVDPNGLTTTMTYDARQRLTSRTVGSETTSYDYDLAGLLGKVTLPDGSFLAYSYDVAHRLTGMQDNLNSSITYTLDLASNRTQEQVRDPSNQLAQTRSRVYSSLNRLFREIGATGQTTEYAYDNQGNVASVKDPLNHTTTNQYDPLNRLKQVTDPNSGVTQYAYNGLDALTQVTDPRSLVTGYSVDGLGNLNQQVSPDTGTTASTYDAAGNLLTQTDAKLQTTTYVYDALNRVTQITFHDGSKQQYAYDIGANALGRLSSIVERNPADQITSVIAYAYEQHGRVTSETRTVGGITYVTAYQYDSSGRMSGMTYPSGRVLAYGFDALGRVNQVTATKDSQSQVVVQNVAYQPFGGVKGFTLGNGQSYTRGYDQDGRIASYNLGGAQYAIGYDAASRISFIADVNTPANSNTYGYDALDRLTSAVLPSTPLAYSYDAVGNRQSKTVGAASDSYTYDIASNRIATLTPASGAPRSFVFDANGSTTNDGQNSYVYDTRGRMTQATSSVGTTNYQVNALGQRVRKTNSATDTVFHYDTRGHLIAESDPGGTVKRELLYLGDIPVAVIQ